MKVIKMIEDSPLTGAKYALVEMPPKELKSSSASSHFQKIKNAQSKKFRANNTRKK